MSKIKKTFKTKDKLISKLYGNIEDLSKFSYLFHQEMEKDPKSKKYAIQKRKYMRLIEDSEKILKDIKGSIETAESLCKKEQKREYLRQDNENAEIRRKEKEEEKA